MSRSFASRLTRAPHPFDPERGQEAAALFPGLPPEVQALLAGAGGCSPYLKSLMEKERDWCEQALSGDPDAALTEVLSDTREIAPDVLGPGLRRAKRRVALLAGLADLGGAWSLEEVTGALTRLADLACQKAITASVAREIARSRIPGARAEDAATGAGMVAIAMGKMGASELNYSSDIDLICLFDDGAVDGDWHGRR